MVDTCTALKNDLYKVKHRQHLRTDGVKLVAWDGIEPSTRGFSKDQSE